MDRNEAGLLEFVSLMKEFEAEWAGKDRKT